MSGRRPRRRNWNSSKPTCLFVLARASADLTDGTFRGNVGHLEQMRSWFGRPLWEMEPSDADACFREGAAGPAERSTPNAPRQTTYFLFLELRHTAEIHRTTGRVIEYPLDEMNRPPGTKDAALRTPPTEPQVKALSSRSCHEVPIEAHQEASALSGRCAARSSRSPGTGR